MNIEDAFRIPTDAEIATAERKLNFVFPPSYIDFLKSGGDVANAVFEPALVLPGCDYLNIFNIAQSAWDEGGVPRDWLPFIEDNGDYFLVSAKGEVRFWSHNGTTNENWPTFAAWFQQVCVERR